MQQTRPSWPPNESRKAKNRHENSANLDKKYGPAKVPDEEEKTKEGPPAVGPKKGSFGETSQKSQTSQAHGGGAGREGGGSLHGSGEEEA